jgi:hypothetical protein
MAPSVRRKKIEKEGELNRRQREAERLADELFFTLKRDDNRYSLCRTVGLKGGSARRDNLSLDQVEAELEKWKLRGYHGG